MTEWLKDVRYVVRMIAKRPGTSAIAIVALALGIGLTTTMFSIVQGVILLIAVIFVMANLLVDIIYTFLDPRIRYG